VVIDIMATMRQWWFYWWNNL